MNKVLQTTNTPARRTVGILSVALVSALAVGCTVTGVATTTMSTGPSTLREAPLFQGQVAVVALSLDNFNASLETPMKTSPMADAPESMVQALNEMHSKAESIFEDRFTGLAPADTFVHMDAYSRVALPAAYPGTFVPTVEGKELTSLVDVERAFNKAMIPVKTAEILGHGLQTDFLAVLHSKWRDGRQNTGVSDDYTVRGRTYTGTVMQDTAICDTTMSIYRPDGQVVLKRTYTAEIENTQTPRGLNHGYEADRVRIYVKACAETYNKLLSCNAEAANGSTVIGSSGDWRQGADGQYHCPSY